ncbi:LysR family transcriptional regulator [Mesorhizobium sp. B2-1-3A]|uniref:LysR family transcriptional regulator n=1 Tax=Mesorhizobium sp. B2-1-3A TaxID=2589971 RepID=UPI001AED9367|nr:LysR family transcriptional regulator [Mesorhizobium sp. B2-1-3A]
MINRIALYHIETLLWIARLGTFNAAAERLNTTQPSISARVRELENHLGFSLFRREGRRMLLTVKGREFAAQCEALWAQLETVLLATEAFSTATGIVKIGCGEIVAVESLPAFLSEIKRLMPNVTLEVEIDLTIHLRHKLEAGAIDFAFLVGPIGSPALEAAPIGTVEMKWLMGRELASRLSRSVDGGEVPDLPVWCLSRPSHLYQVMAESLRQSNLKRPVINTCNHVRTLIDVVASSGGMAILPELLVRDRIARGEFVPVPEMVADPIAFFAVVRKGENEPIVLEMLKRARDLRLG